MKWNKHILYTIVIYGNKWYGYDYETKQISFVVLLNLNNSIYGFKVLSTKSAFFVSFVYYPRIFTKHNKQKHEIN